MFLSTISKNSKDLYDKQTNDSVLFSLSQHLLLVQVMLFYFLLEQYKALVQLVLVYQVNKNRNRGKDFYCFIQVLAC
jgi:hypothetical protein